MAISFAASPLEEFLSKSFEPGMNVQVSRLLSSENYSVVLLDGKEIYVVDDLAGKPVQDREKIENLLKEDAKSRQNYQQKISSAMNLVKDVQNAKNKTEAQCMLLTGTDMHECKDKDSCVLACMSNPNCATPLYSDGFWEALLDWSNARRKYGELLEKYQAGLDKISSEPSAIDEKKEILAQLHSTAKNMSLNPLFLNRTDEGCSGKTTKRCYEYCPKIDYSASRIEAEIANLEGIKVALLDAKNQPARAEEILKEGAKYDAYLSTRMKDYAELRVKISSSLKKVNETAKEAALKVKDPSIYASIEQLSKQAENIGKKGDENRYKEALEMGKDYQQKLEEVKGRIDSNLKKYEEVLEKIDGAVQKLEKSRWLVGNQTYLEHLAKLEALKQELVSAPVTLEEMEEIRMKVIQEDMEINAAISQKAAEVASGSSPISQEAIKEIAAAQIPKNTPLPCLPAFALAAIGVAVLLARKGS
ncbi:MAG: hypothetical protein QW275_01020 [Candidatus Anstonellaceae archaeon]